MDSSNEAIKALAVFIEQMKEDIERHEKCINMTSEILAIYSKRIEELTGKTDNRE